jgi:hypothetical protein
MADDVSPSEGFRKKFEQACDDARGVNNPVEVRAKVKVQAGQEILLGRCRCGEHAALSGEGRHLCRRCGTWLRYIRDE